VSAAALPGRLALVVAVAASLAGAARGEGRIDVMVGGERKTITGVRVELETLDEVRYRRGGRSRTDSKSTEDVVLVRYGPGSKAFEDAEEQLAQGELANAEKLFATASQDAEPPWVGAVAKLREAEVAALRGPSHVRDAVRAVDEFLTDHPDHRLTPRALLLKARYAAAAGDLADADAAIDQLLGLAGSGRVTPDWTVRALLEKGEYLLSADRASDARAALDEAQDSIESARGRLGERTDLEPVLDDLALQVRTGIGGAILAGGDADAARDYFARLAEDGKDDIAIQIAAINGQAEADFADSSRLKNAQLGFARAAVLGAGVPDEHAKALYFLGRCAQALDEAGRERGGRTKALEYYHEVQDRYPNSRWARRARESLP